MKRLLLLLLIAPSPLIAVLSPLYESITEIEALLQQLPDHLGSEQALLEIVRTPGGYLVLTRDYQVVIDLNYLPQTRPGPQQFQLLFHTPVSLDN
jgi:hypothetical protein